MVGLYEDAYHVGDVVLLRQFESLGDVAYDDARAVLRLEAGVGIDARLVLGEEYGVYEFAYVMVQGSCTY